MMFGAGHAAAVGLSKPWRRRWNQLLHAERQLISGAVKRGAIDETEFNSLAEAAGAKLTEGPRTLLDHQVRDSGLAWANNQDVVEWFEQKGCGAWLRAYTRRLEELEELWKVSE